MPSENIFWTPDVFSIVLIAPNFSERDFRRRVLASHPMPFACVALRIMWLHVASIQAIPPKMHDRLESLRKNLKSALNEFFQWNTHAQNISHGSNTSSLQPVNFSGIGISTTELANQPCSCCVHVMRAREKTFPVTKLDLVRRSYEPEVKVALERWLEIESKGGTPQAWWSKHNGYRVVDEDEWIRLNARLRREAVTSS